MVSHEIKGQPFLLVNHFNFIGVVPFQNSKPKKKNAAGKNK